jgi:hypothetical protein
MSEIDPGMLLRFFSFRDLGCFDCSAINIISCFVFICPVITFLHCLLIAHVGEAGKE